MERERIENIMLSDTDKLDRIFALQAELDGDISERRGLDKPSDGNKCEWIQRKTLAMVSELAELLDEVNFKWWKNPKQIDDDRIKSELVDILHFFVSMCLTAGMDAGELYGRYLDKNKENFDRQYGRSAKKGYDVEERKPEGKPADRT